MSKFIIAAFALLLWGAGPSLSYADKRLLVVGDSLSAAYGIALNAGWVALLGDHLKQQGTSIEVINASISGETTQGGVARLPALLQAYEPAVVIIELGANDGLQGFPLQLMRDNLQQMIRQSKRSGARVLLVGMRIPPNYGTKYTAIFFHSYQQLAKQEQIAMVPFLLEGIATEEGMMQADGLHPTAAAQATLLQTILPELLPLLDDAPGIGELAL